MALIYNYILGYDTDENAWFHNIEAEEFFMDNKTVFNTKYEEYIAEYQGNGIYLSDAERLIESFNEAIETLNKKEIEAVAKKLIAFHEAVERIYNRDGD
jgi:predicted Zn-dependent peptidase